VRPKITIARLQQMKRDGQKIVAVVVYDYPMARIADRAGVDIVSVGDSVGVNMWGHAAEEDITLDEMLVVCRAVDRGATHALVSCDVPGRVRDVVDAARALVHDGGAAIVKLDADPSTIHAIVEAGVPVWAQMSGQAAGGRAQEVAELVERAHALETAGASLLDFRHSGPVLGPAVAKAVSIPVIGGLGGGPWLDGRVRAIANAIGYSATALDDQADRYANVARVGFEAITAYSADVRGGRQVRGK
jgi:3-methyl-2-oxobutanoate hydroxymethyltransferase